jgi:DNA mismatch repair protein MSH6
MIELAATSESFTSKTISGLLRSAPDLLPNIKNVEAMYKKPEKGTITFADIWRFEPHTCVDTDDLVPEEGKDEVYDGIMEELGELEAELDSELSKLEKKLGYVTDPSVLE